MFISQVAFKVRAILAGCVWEGRCKPDAGGAGVCGAAAGPGAAA